MGKIIIGILLFTSISLLGQKSSGWKYAETITAEELKKHLEIIASDDFEGRETGKLGQKKAMNYLIKQFKSYGIAGVKMVEEESYVQTFELIEQENKNIELNIKEKSFSLNKDFSISPKIVTNREIEEEVLFIGYGIEEKKYNNYKGINIEGKTVFIMPGMPSKVRLEKKWTRRAKFNLAKEKGAAAIVYYDKNLAENLKKYEHFYKKPSTKLKSELKEEVIIVSVTAEVAEYILEKGKLSLKKIEKKEIKENSHFRFPFKLTLNKPTKELTGENVLAFIPGDEKKEELVIITAHYDHIGKDGGKIFNGADDDGTGTVSLLELAQAFQTAIKEGNKPKRSILIMPVSGEEKGLLGSSYYTNNPIFPLENTVVDLNIDMIGRYDDAHEEGSNYIYLIGSDKLSTDLHDLSEEVNSKTIDFELDYRFNDDDDPNRFYYRSDHYNFAKKNIPVIFYFSGVHEDYHKPTDTIEKIDFEKTQNIARLVFMTAWEIANREERILLD